MKPSRIQVLPRQIAERIAAGEVIERPASVIKELVENSIDAGATQIEVIVEEGGKNLIQVTDDGCGMTADELVLSIQRHATSKIKTLHDLETLSSLGFRGEALPSVAAVADVEILSRAVDEIHSHKILIEDTMASPVTRETHGHFLGQKNGTRFRARNLFSKVPARLKFLKSQSSETSAVREILERLALTHPSMAIRLIADDRTLLDFKPQTEAARVATVLAGESDSSILTHSTDREGIRVRVHWIKGSSFSQTRKLAQVVNNRAIRDKLIQQAMLHSFKQHLLPGQFPAAAVYLEVDPALMDVNVHPTKSEIRFIESRKIFHAIESAFDKLIRDHGAGLTVGGFSQNPNSGQNPSLAPHFFVPQIMSAFSGTPSSFSKPEQSNFAHIDTGQYLGQMFSTYLLFERNQKLQVIDQHAAHERIRYEELKRVVLQRTGLDTQPLLIPEVIHIEAERLLDGAALLSPLETLGFEFEKFSESSLVFRSIPAAWGFHNLNVRLKNLSERMLDRESDSASNVSFQDEKLFEVIASEACHSSIRAGEVLHDLEARNLAQKLMKCENPWNCPHCRPTVVELTEGKFEEWFKRRV